MTTLLNALHALATLANSLLECRRQRQRKEKHQQREARRRDNASHTDNAWRDHFGQPAGRVRLAANRTDEDVRSDSAKPHVVPDRPAGLGDPDS